MRMETRGAGCWLAGLIAALALTGGTASASALGAPYTLQGFDWGNGRLEYAAAGDGSLLVVTEQADLGTTQITRYGTDGQLAAAHSMSGTWSDIASNRLGNYVVANVTAQGVFASVFNRAGVALVPRFQVSDRGVTLQVAMNEAGVFVAVYNAYVNPSNGPVIYSTYARVFNADGSPRTGEIQIASGDAQTNLQSWGVAMDGAGNFVVNQTRVSNGAVEHGLYRYTRDGALLTTHHDVTDRAGNGEGGNEIISLAANSSGQHVFGWYGTHMTTYASAIRFQRFDAGGGKSGPIELLGQDPAGTVGLGYGETKVAIAGDGRVLAVWAQRSSFTDQNAQWNVYGREYGVDGTSLTGAFRIDTTSASAVLYPSTIGLAMTFDGQYTVTWGESDAGQGRQLARRYRMEGGPAVQTLSSGVPIGGLSAAVNTFQYFRFTVPPNTPSFSLTLSGGGDADMLVKYGEPPTLGSYDMSTAIDGSNEGALINNPPAGDFYVGLFGYTAYSGVSLQADW